MPTSPEPIRTVVFAARLEALACGRTSGFGGAENELWNMALRLAECEELDVRALILTDEIAQPKSLGKLQLHPVKPSDKITYSDSLLKRRWAIFKYFGNLFNAMRKQKARIYYTKLACSEASTVWLASRAAGGKFVFRIEHDWETNYNDLIKIIFRGSRFWAHVFVFCLKRADMVIAQTRKQAESLKNNYNVNCVLIPNGHNIPDDKCISNDPSVRPDVIWVGRTDPVKRPFLFIELAKEHPQYHFVMIMPPSTENMELFNNCRAAANEVANLSFVPGVAANEIDAYYQRARVLVLTSTAEGFSNVIIEALKNGAPAISLGHNPDDLLLDISSGSVPEPYAGFYTADAPGQTQVLLRQLLENPVFWRECHFKARTMAVENFGIDSVLAEYRKQFVRLGETS